MSEASLAPAAAPAAAAPAPAPAPAAAPAAAAPATSLTGDGAAPASSANGEVTGAAAPGQGAVAEQGGVAAAPASGEAPKAGEGEATTGAPEAYASFTMAEGYELAGDMLDSVTAFAKAHNMTQEQAQGLVDLGGKQATAIQTAYAELASKSPVMLKDHWAQTWSGQTQADAEIGGQHLEPTLALSRRVFATFGTPELGEFLDQTGIAHHPELIRFMHKVGKAVSEDTLVLPQGDSSRTQVGRDPARKLYPNMN